MFVVFMCMVLGVCTATHGGGGVTLPEDVARREANHANNERQRVRKQRRRLRSVARAAVRARGEETPSESGSSRADEVEDEEEGEIISSPPSPSPKSLPSPSDLFRQQVGIPTSAYRAKHPRVDADGVSIPPP
jgi:hypothetical protein